MLNEVKFINSHKNEHVFGGLYHLSINVLIGLVRLYQVLLSPLHGPVCRFQPTCSEYFVQALQKKGIIQGVIYGLWRLLKCHPWGGSGYDPV